MISHNLALLTPEQRADIELNKQASLIAFKLKMGQASRADAKEAIEASFDGDKLRKLINKYRGLNKS